MRTPDYSHTRKVGILVVLDLQLVAKVAKNSVLKILNVIFQFEVFLSGLIINFSQLCLFFNWRYFTRRGLFCYDVHLSVFYRRVFMNHLKLVDQKMIIIVLVLLYFLNLKIVELIPVTGHLFVSLCFICVLFFFVIRKSKNSITLRDYFSSSLEFPSKIV